MSNILLEYVNVDGAVDAFMVCNWEIIFFFFMSAFHETVMDHQYIPIYFGIDNKDHPNTMVD